MTDKQKQELIALIEKVSYGEILINFEAGRVAIVEVNKKIKLSE